MRFRGLRETSRNISQATVKLLLSAAYQCAQFDVWTLRAHSTLRFFFFSSFLLSVNRFTFLRSAPLLPPSRCIVGSCSWALWFLTAGLTYQHAYGWKWKHLLRATAKDAGVYSYPMTNYRSPNDAWARRRQVSTNDMNANEPWSPLPRSTNQFDGVTAKRRRFQHNKATVLT